MKKIKIAPFFPVCYTVCKARSGGRTTKSIRGKTMKIKKWLNWGDSRKAVLHNIAKMLGIIALALVISVALSQALRIGSQSIIMVFLIGVLFCSVTTASIAYGVLASCISLILFNYFFTEPRFTFIVASTNDLILLVFFMVTAVVSGMVTTRLQNQMELTVESERTARKLYRLALSFLTVNGESNIVAEGISCVRENTGLECQVCLRGEELETAFGIAYNDFDILSSEGSLGTLRVFTNGRTLSERDRMILSAIATHLGIALYREKLRAEQENIRVAMEREQQRSMLLRSVAHDLRSPLTALYGTGSLLADRYDSLSDQERREMAVNMSEEILWLINLIENILNMTRINENRLVLHKSRETLDDMVSEAAQHTKRLMEGRRFTVQLPEEVVVLPTDGKLIVQTIINLLENAVKHTPDTAEVRLTASTENGLAYISVADTGNGVPDAMKEKIFDRFVMGHSEIADGKRGLGLGLAICRAIVEAHGGKIWVEDNPPHGARFVFTIPLEEGLPHENSDH